MSQISVNNLTFSYESTYDNIFDHTTFEIDTDWKLGFIGRNGKGKTTFLNLLLGKYEYQGMITCSVHFDYFPFLVKDSSKNTIDIMKEIIAPFKEWEEKLAYYENNYDDILKKSPTEIKNLDEEYSNVLNQYMYHDGYTIDEFIKKEISLLKVEEEVLYRPFETLSNGEQTKLLLAALFLKKNNFLLIDEPTNHLDIEGRELVRDYLNSKKGFILVSHDRDFLDHVIDHVLSINRSNIEVMKGNFSVWQENKELRDQFELKENERLKREMYDLEKAIKRTSGWADSIEKTKIGHGPVDRGYIGAKSAKMMKHAKAYETRHKKAMEEKSKLLKDIDVVDDLKMNVLSYHKERYVDFCDISLWYQDQEKPIIENISFQVNKGDRIALSGSNGCGKSSIIKLLLSQEANKPCNIEYSGTFKIGKELKISYVPQNTDFLKGNLKDYAMEHQIDESLLKMALRKLDLPRIQFEKNMEDYSGGQKKKVLLAHSLVEPAHLFIWDEPLNFIDVLSRVQIEELLLKYQPTMIFVDHDLVFKKKIATKIINLEKR